MFTSSIDQQMIAEPHHNSDPRQYFNADFGNPFESYFGIALIIVHNHIHYRGINGSNVIGNEYRCYLIINIIIVVAIVVVVIIVIVFIVIFVISTGC